jgi:hypothetical protein
MGDAIILKNKTDIEFVNVPISVDYAMQRNVDYIHDTFSDMYIHSSLLSSSGADTAELGTGITGTFGKGYFVQGIDYTISGIDITFITIPSGVQLTFGYIGNITYATYSEVVDVPFDNALYTYALQEPVDYIHPLYSGLIIYDQLYSGIFG